MAIYEPNEEQKKQLLKMLYYALLEIRILGAEGKAEQAGDLADTFHNLPVCLDSPEFDWAFFREAFLRGYQEKYPHPNSRFNYLTMFDAIEKLKA